MFGTGFALERADEIVEIGGKPGKHSSLERR
jgi:hypothetical protein